MKPPPDEFTRRVHVRLPLADSFLAGGDKRKQAEDALKKAFERPLLTVPISPERRRHGEAEA